MDSGWWIIPLLYTSVVKTNKRYKVVTEFLKMSCK